jgi:ATP-binding cassette subfamily B protein
VTRDTTDVEALGELFSNGIVGILANLVMVLFFLAGMMALSARLTLTLAAALPVFVAMTIVFRRVAMPAQQQGRILIARLNALIAEHVNGIAVVQLFNRQEASEREFERVNFQYMVASKGWMTANAWFMPAVELMGTVSQAALLWVGASLLTGGRLTIGVLIAFLQYGAKFLRPIQDVSERYGTLQTGIVSAERVFRLLDTSAPSGEATVALPTGTDIEFDGVWFAYVGEEWVLRDVSFVVEARQCLAVVGHTGAGKTTLINLLLRFYEPQIGSIRVGGVDIRTMDVAALRRQFGVVLQDTYVHEGSVLENIHFGLETDGEANAREAARLAQVDRALGALPKGLDTQIVERGGNLSAGQKQLIGIARAICRDPKLLILDEATSDIDTETEARIQRALTGLLAGRTSIIIAHRLTTVLRADRVLLLHKGVVREWGTHAELLARRGLYWRLYQLQYGPQQRPEPEAVGLR